MIRAYKVIMSDVSKIIYREVLVKQLVLRRALFVVDYQEYVVKELFILLTWSKRDCRCVSNQHRSCAQLNLHELLVVIPA